MYKIDLIDKLIEQYKLWTLDLQEVTTQLEYNILQKHSINIFQEKLINFSVAFFIVYIGLYIVSFIGVYEGNFIIGFFLFISGFYLSTFVYEKLFNKKRDIINISDEEKSLILNLQKIQNKHFEIRDNLNQNNIIVNFSNYTELKKDFDLIYIELQNFNTNNLTLKNRTKHTLITQEYKKQIDIFHSIYANR